MDFEKIGLKALEAAYVKQVELSNNGTIGLRVSKGTGGDTSLRGDIESESEVIKVLAEKNFPAIIYAEEHCAWKPMRIGTDDPKYLVVIDGFDGSSALAKNPKSRGGTMLAIAKNPNPQYKDFLFGGITDFSTNRIIYSLRERAVFLNTYDDKKTGAKLESRLLQSLNMSRLNAETKIHLDDPEYWKDYAEGITSQLDDISMVTRENFTKKLEGKVKVSGLNSSGAMCMDLVIGKVDAICGVSAKGVFEQPAEYPIIRILNGTIADYSGKDIGDDYWLIDRESHKKNPVPSLRASSHYLAMEILKYVKSN
ncbi:MAG: hypothetical protein AABX93_02410 [Nanoarchaeota archaeon]